MSINIPCGSSNPIGVKMPPPTTPPPPLAEDTKSAIQKAVHDREAPAHLVGDKDVLHKKGLDNTPKGQGKGVKGAEDTEIKEGKGKRALQWERRKES
ncbi:hypothetical protein AOL_s00078g140 [Orbilia oligospora ATCC 24927]|uniref:Uncharacterized protein n=1 Tax=Arthrobotrys oligospora (strain ATCC 24927 / CBS 115.81 / DSM 1491) TaxID=756982 RepID=G1XB43_ARTOA|nr:hypothetical protein AOL_s00078g140 [Orbilia oligospora ATCC 24927]EGX49651.1 hypothetical protein AOL_s00078g140 [Orbilia oligospora ATCC 24927]